MTQLKSDSPIQKRQIVNLQIIDDDVASAAGIVTSKLADGYLFIKADGTVDFIADESHGGFKITDLGAPVNDNDAVRLIDLTGGLDGVVYDSDFTSQGIILRGETSGSYSILTNNSTDWNTAFGWGDHTLVGYLTSLAHNLAGDVSGAYGANTVDKIKNKTIATLATGFMKYDGVGFVFDASTYLTSQTSHLDVVVDGDFTSEGIILRGATSGSYSILTNNSTNWNTVFTQMNGAYLTTNYLPKWDGSKLVNSITYDDGTTFCIGTTTGSGYKLNVNGTALFATSATTPTIRLTTGATVDYYWRCTNVDGSGSWVAIAASQVYKGTINGSTGIPTVGGNALINDTGTSGWYYRCAVAGTYDYGNPSGNSITLALGDEVHYDGSVWQYQQGVGYTLTTATVSVLGGIKVGGSLQINSSVLDIGNGDKGDIVVSGTGGDIGNIWTIDTASVTLAKMADMATSSLIYRRTSGSGVPEVNTLAQLKTDLGLTNSNSGDQTITLTTDVSGTGTGSFATTIQAGVVTFAKFQNVSTAVIIGRIASGSGSVTELSPSQIRTLINVSDGANNYIHPNHSGEVTSVADGAQTITAKAVTMAKIQDITTASLIYRRTAGTGVPEVNTLAQLKIDLGLTNSNSGDQTITLNTDVVGSGTGTFATTIQPGVVTYAKFQNVATSVLIGRVATGTGSVTALSIAQVQTLLNVADGANAYVHPHHGRSGTGDATSVGDADITINARAVTFPKVRSIDTASILGRLTASTGDIEVLTLAQVRTMLYPTSPLVNTLTDGYIFVGNSSNVATGVPVTSQISITNAGVATISNAAVIAKVLTGYTATSGTITAADSILTALQKVGYNQHVPVTLKTGSKTYIELVGQEINATAIDLGGTYITGTISSTVLGNSSFYIGTTQIALNRTSAAQSLTGITSIDGSAAKWTTARLLGGNSVDGSANVPLANKFIVQGTTDSGLTNAQFLGALTTGLVKNTTSTGVLSITPDNTANWDIAYNDRVISASFDNDTGDLTITQQDAGTVVANLDWRYMLKEGRLLNDQWFESYDYAGNITNVFKVSKDNLIEFGNNVGIQSLYTVADAGKVTLAEMPVVYSSAGLEMSYCLSIDGGGQFKVIGITDGVGGLSSDYVLVDTELHISSILHATPYTEDKILVSALGIVKYVSGSELIEDLGLDTRYLIFKTISLSSDSGFTWGSSSVVADLYNDTLTLVAGTNISIYTDAANDAIKISNTYSYTHPAKTWVDKSDLSGVSIISNLTIDSLGHPTGWTTRSLTLTDLGYSGDSQADHYQYWTINGDTGTENIGIMGSVTFVGGDALTTVYAPSTNTLTINHEDTSTATNLTASGRTYVTGLTFDTYGHTTGYTTGTETTIWVANSLNVAGYVAAPGAVANKVWKTDVSGNPSWRDDTDTLYYPGSFLTGTTTLSLNVSGSVSGGQIPFFSATQLNTDNSFYYSASTQYTPNLVASGLVQSNTIKIVSGAASGKVLVSDSVGNGVWTAQSFTDTNYYPTGMSFATGTGVLTMSGIGMSNVTVSLDGRYSLSDHTHTTYVPYTGATGSVTLGSWDLSAHEVTATSDRRQKINITPIELKPISAEYVQYNPVTRPDQLKYGIIAQELLKDNPELVRGNYDDGYQVSYTDLLIKEVAYLKDEVRKLKLLVYGN